MFITYGFNFLTGKSIMGLPLDEILKYYPDEDTVNLIINTSCDKVDDYVKDPKFFHKYSKVLNKLLPCIRDVSALLENLDKELYLGDKLSSWRVIISAFKKGLVDKDFIDSRKNTLSQVLTQAEGWEIILEIIDLVRDKIEENKKKLYELLPSHEELWEVVYKGGIAIPSLVLEDPHVKSGSIKSKYFWKFLLTRRKDGTVKQIVINGLKRGNLTAWYYSPEFVRSGVISENEIYSNSAVLLNKIRSKSTWMVIARISPFLEKDLISQYISIFFERLFDGKIFVKLLKSGILTSEYREYYLELLMFDHRAWVYVDKAVKYNLVSKEELEIFREYFEYFVKVFPDLKRHEKKIRQVLGWA